jgi:hypothetical protein
MVVHITAREVCFRSSRLKEAGTSVLESIQDQIGGALREGQSLLLPGIGHQPTGYQVTRIPRGPRQARQCPPGRNDLERGSGSRQNPGTIAGIDTQPEGLDRIIDVGKMWNIVIASGVNSRVHDKNTKVWRELRDQLADMGPVRSIGTEQVVSFEIDEPRASRQIGHDEGA